MSKMKVEDALMEMSSWEICRICGGNDCDLVPIYDENGITLQLEEKINHYLPITVSQEDELPLYMCVPCIEKLNTTHELIVICLEADEKLKELLHLKKKYLELNVSKLRKEAKAFTIKNNGIVYEKESVETSNENEDSLHQSCQASSMAPLSECEKESEETSILNEDSVHQNCQASSMAPLSELEDYEAPELDVKEEEENDPVTCDPETDLEDKKEVEAIADIRDLLVPKEYKDEEYDTADEVKEEIIMDNEEDEIKTVLLVNGYSGAESGEQSQCRYCRQICDDLETHLQSSVCEYCGTHFACPGTLQVHEQLQHQKEHFRCTVPGCYKKYQDKSKLEEHAAEHGVDEPWLCDVCGRSFVTASNLRSHSRSHQEVPKEHKCSMCPKQFRSRFNLRKHMMSHTGEKPFLCECCSKRFASKETLKQHLVIHSREKPFKCTMCPFSTVRRGNLAKHYETHADAKFECKICHKSFATRYDLQNHHYTHTDEELSKIIELEGPGMLVCRTFRCDQCGKFLSSKASLIIHQRMHSGDRPFQCSECGKRFSQKPSLDYHVRLHTGERPHQCVFCGQGFNSKAAKESHERVHTGEKPYRCNTCSARFRNCANLRQHQLIHNDSREHPCSVCGKRFRRREAVQVHMRVHTGERPYSCPLCLKKFTQKGDQLKHTRAHIMKNDRRCSFCGKEFPNRRELKQHSCERKIVADTHHFDTVLLNPTQLIANTEITVVTAEMPETP